MPATPAAPEDCPTRVYMPTADARLIALNAETGEVCTSFANQGVLRLEAGMPFNPAGYYYSTSPPVAVAGKIIIGGAAVTPSFSDEIGADGYSKDAVDCVKLVSRLLS